MANELTKPEFKTTMVKIGDSYLDMIAKQLESHNIPMDAYRNTCVLNAVSAIQNVLEANSTTLNADNVDQTSVTQCLHAVALFKLNALVSPREIYFIVRSSSKMVNGEKVWGKKKIEMGIEGDGNDAILRRFGAGVKTVHPYWVVCEGDEFVPPRHVGIEVTPPIWTPKGTGGAPFAVVYPITMDDGVVNYHIAYRDSVKANLLSHISNNMQKETFGICAEAYKANEKQKQEIYVKKHGLLTMAEKSTLEDTLSNPELFSWLSPAWREPQNRELMIIRKMRNNIVKKIPKNFESDSAIMSYNEYVEDEPVTKDVTEEEEAVQSQTLDIIPEKSESIAKITRPPKTHPKPQVETVEEPEPKAEAPEVVVVDSAFDIEDGDPDVFDQSDRMNGIERQVGF